MPHSLGMAGKSLVSLILVSREFLVASSTSAYIDIVKNSIKTRPISMRDFHGVYTGRLPMYAHRDAENRDDRMIQGFILDDATPTGQRPSFYQGPYIISSSPIIPPSPAPRGILPTYLPTYLHVSYLLLL
ncbi:hypothetical protein F5Y04DRAFT_266496, partial [Hypomontagnella monticulosa]